MGQLHVINDGNYLDYVHMAEDRGHVAGCKPRITAYGGLKCAAPRAEYIKTIPENEWIDRIRAMDAAKAWPDDHMQAAGWKIKDQNGLNYCWAYSLTGVLEVKRIVQGQSYVELLPESLGGDVNFRNDGNALDSALAYAAKNGVCDAGFATPHSLSPSRWKAGWKDEALNHKPEKWWDIGQRDMWAETVSAMLCGEMPYVGLDWWGHAVFYVRLLIDRNEICPKVPNSWGTDWGDNGYCVLQGNKKIPSLGCFTPVSETISPT